MATKTKTSDKSLGSDALEVITWATLNNGDVGEAYLYKDVAFEKTVQVDGTFGTGGTLVFEGSNDGTNWVTMKDNSGTALSVTNTFVRNVFDAPIYYRPRVSAGDGTTNLRCILVLRKQINRPF